jgi:hypothetical protein
VPRRHQSENFACILREDLAAARFRPELATFEELRTDIDVSNVFYRHANTAHEPVEQVLAKNPVVELNLAVVQLASVVHN